jgi:transcriptional regulator with XRE-family HTH domain
MDYKKAIIKNIKKYCSLRKITYSELARKAHIPLTTLQAILYDERYKEPRLSNAHSIAKALQISLDDLIK